MSDACQGCFHLTFPLGGGNHLPYPTSLSSTLPYPTFPPGQSGSVAYAAGPIASFGVRATTSHPLSHSNMTSTLFSLIVGIRLNINSLEKVVEVRTNKLSEMQLTDHPNYTINWRVAKLRKINVCLRPRFVPSWTDLIFNLKCDILRPFMVPFLLDWCIKAETRGHNRQPSTYIFSTLTRFITHHRIFVVLKYPLIPPLSRRNATDGKCT